MNTGTSVISVGPGAGLLRLRRPDRGEPAGGAIPLPTSRNSGVIRWRCNSGPALARGLLVAALLSPALCHGQGASKANADQDAAAKTSPAQAATAASGSQPAKNADALYGQALELEKQGNVVDAVKLYGQAARGGSAAAAKRLGDIYKTGKGGVARDAQTSLKYYAMAKQGIPSGKDMEPKEEAKAGPEKAKAEQEAADAKATQEAAVAKNKVQQEAAAKAKAEQESAAAKASEQEAAAAKAKSQQEAVAARARSQQVAAAKAKADQDAAAKATPAQIASAASVPQPAKNADALYSEALGLENQGNVVDAVKLYEQAARGGSAAAAKKLGDIYKTGKGGVAHDAQASLKYYAMAKQGLPSGKDKESKEEPKAGADKAKAEQDAADAKAAQEAAVARAKMQQEAAAKAKAEQETAAAKARSQQEAAAKAKAEQEVAAKAKAQQETAAKARAEQETAAKAKAEQEAAAKARAEQEAAAKARAEQEAAAKARAEQEIAAKAKAEQESAAAKAREQATAAAKAQPEAAAKAKADQEAAAKALPTQLASSASGPQPAKSPDALYSQGLALEEQGNVLEAVKLYEQAVKAGSGPAAKKLGEIYGKGKGGVVRDGQASLRYFALAKQRGEAVR